ncbi:MAG: DUF2283 domain-containing protein [Planctomycetes bacterium]|nr:DUF2283 domain-containing protein [Planctomycetota bacterium]
MASRSARRTQALVDRCLCLAAVVSKLPSQHVWLDYDREADVLYVTLKKPSHADDSELTDNDIIMRYEGDEVVGITILHASKRRPHKRPLRQPTRNRVAWSRNSPILGSKEEPRNEI